MGKEISTPKQEVVGSDTFVQAEEFCQLLLSSRQMVRSDERESNLRGLLDLETGRRYLIDQEQLLNRSRHPLNRVE